MASSSYDMDRPIVLWDVRTRRPAGVLRDPTNWVNALAFSRDGTRLISATGEFDGTIDVWDIASGKVIASSIPGDQFGGLMGCSADGRTLAAARVSGGVKVFDVKSD